MMDILSSFVNLVPVTLAQSLLYGFVALGIMIPFRLLSFPDLTCEGAFPLGGCLCAALLVAGVAPVLSMIIAIFAGVLAGCATAFIHLRFKINTLLAGILMITILWSINLRIMGKSNIPSLRCALILRRYLSAGSRSTCRFRSPSGCLLRSR